MDTLLEYLPQVLILLLIVGSFLFFNYTKAGSELGFSALFAVVAFAFPTAIVAGVSLAAIDFLYPQAMVVDGFVDLIWVVALASLASTVVFDLGVEGLLLRVLQKLGMSMSSISIVEEIAASLFIALALFLVSTLMPGAELSVGVALVTGLICGFARYMIGLYMREDFAKEGQTEVAEFPEERD